jgi:nanoRNase/pAp phosphatase (c-di-AMP/oligoRNAs hydrolase)
MTTSFVDACVETVAGSAQRVQKHAGGRIKAKRLLRALAGKKRVLVTTHMHPDPDALASITAMRHLLRAKLTDAQVDLAVKGQIGGGINEAFTRFVKLDALPWDENLNLADFDAIVLLDVQPNFAYSPLPPEITPTAVIDHHGSRGRRPKWAFCDIRRDVGSTCSIVFSYFMDLEVPIPAELGATLLYGVESDLAGAAAVPASLDNMALSSLTLLADPNLINQMRYVDLPRSYYAAYACGLSNAMWYDSAVITHLGEIDSLEKPAVIADFLLRFDQVTWALVTAVHGGKLILSLRTQAKDRSAGDAMKRLVRRLGEGGGHRAKAGGFVPLENSSDAEVERNRKTLRRRLLRMLHVRESRGQRLVPKSEC